MRFGTKVMGFVAASAFMCGAAWACPNDEGTGCSGKAKATMASDTAKCDGKMSACVPQISMMVGDKTYECPMAAAEAAKKEGKSITYKVAGKSFECKDKAMAAYADVMDEFVVKFASVRTVDECQASCQAHGACTGDKSSCKAEKTAAKGGCCSGDKTVAAKGEKSDKSAKSASAMYCVAGQTFSCKDKAAEASKVAMAAMKEVKVGYRVGSKDFCCDKMAGEAAKKNGEKVVYVVGKEKIECPIQARIETAKAKIAAAMSALTKGTQQKA